MLYYIGNLWLFQPYYQNIGKCSKSYPMGENWNIDTHNFYKSIAIAFHERFTLYVLRHMRNTWVFLSISQNMEKGNKIRPMTRIWDIDTYTFSKFFFKFYFLLLFHGILSYCILHSMYGTCVFTRISRSMVKLSGTPLSYGKKLEYWCSYFSQNMGYLSSVELPSQEILRRDTLSPHLLQKMSPSTYNFQRISLKVVSTSNIQH